MVQLTAFASALAGASQFTTGSAPCTAPTSLIASQRSAVFAKLDDGQQPQDEDLWSNGMELNSLQAGFKRDKFARDMLQNLIFKSNMEEKKLYWLRKALNRQVQADSANKNGVEFHYDPENDLTGKLASTIDPKSTFQTSTETPSVPPRDHVDNRRAQEIKRSRAAMNDFAGDVAAAQQGSGAIFTRWEQDDVRPVAIPDHYMKVQVNGAEVEMNYVDIGRMSVQEAKRRFCNGQETPLSGNIQLAMEQMREEQMREEQVLELPLNEILSVPKPTEGEVAAGNLRQPECSVDTASYEYELPVFVGIKGLAKQAEETVVAIYARMRKMEMYNNRPLYFVEMADVQKWRANTLAEKMEHDWYNFNLF